MKKILICGDSFAVDYKNLTSNNPGWSSLLSNNFLVTNLSQAGASEYRILKQIKNENIDLYDAIIISHTSPNRLYVNEHPIHKNNAIHQNSDLLYNDVVYHANLDPDNKILMSAKNYFENIFDMTYHEDLFFLIADQINLLANDKPCLNLFTLYDKNCNKFQHYLNLKKQFKIVPGQTNHYTSTTNLQISNLIKKWIDLVTN